uniref:PGG domain-containing protein n=2 Tax=Macrostomum lignano TaxID=282301 RepID=A0A1I8HG31_9PLAT
LHRLPEDSFKMLKCSHFNIFRNSRLFLKLKFLLDLTSMRSMYHNWVDGNTRILSDDEVVQVRKLLRRYRGWYILFSALFAITFTGSLALFTMAYQQRRILDPESKQFKAMLYAMSSSSLLAMLFCLIMSHLQCQSLEILKAVYIKKMQSGDLVGEVAEEPDSTKKTV